MAGCGDEPAGTTATPAAGGSADHAPDSAARRLGDAASALDKQGQHAVSAVKFAEAAKLADSEGDARLANAYRAQSAVCLKMSDQPEPALALLLPALATARENGDRHTEGLALGNLVRVESMLGHDEQALRYLDELVGFAGDEKDTRLQVLTLEQAAAAALSLGEPAAALDRIALALPLAAALEADGTLAGNERRSAGLLSLQASARVALGDDEGAFDAWASLPETSAVLGNRARHAVTLGNAAQAAELALRAAQGFDAEGGGRLDERDRALALALSELLEAGDLDGAEGRLTKLLAAPQDELALAPFLVLRGQLALLRGHPLDAPADFERARAALVGTPPADEVGLLLAWTQLVLERRVEAAATLAALKPGLAHSLLSLRLLTAEPPGTMLIREALPDLSPRRFDPGDDTLRLLDAQTGGAMPSLPYALLDAGLKDTERLQAQGGAMAGVVLANAARDALRWQALLGATAVPGLMPDASGIAELDAWVDRWVDRRQPEGHALLVVLPGETSSYLLLCTHALGATTFALPNARALQEKAQAVVDATRASDVRALAVAAHALYTTVLPPRAQQDLSDASHWTIILPPELAAVPPSMWVTAPPSAGEDVAWLVNDHVVTLRPHAPVAGAALPEVTPEGGTPGWLSMGAPALDRTQLPLVSEQWFLRYGDSAFNAAPVKPVQPGVALAGPNATIAALRVALPLAAGLQLSVPGAGGGRLGGLLFAPAPGSPFHDEAAGFLPWHRFTQMALPPQVILDSTRFDPGDQKFGPGYAASALLSHASEVLFTRWPMPGPVRDAMVAHLQAERESGKGLPEALAAVQRSWLATVRESGDLAASHPRLWAAWLPYGGAD